MKLDTEKYLTVADLALAMGATVRAAQRAVLRAVEAGEIEVVTLYGKRLVRRSDVAKVDKFYFPFGTDKRSAMARAAGAKGGTTKQLRWREQHGVKSGKAGKAKAAEG